MRFKYLKYLAFALGGLSTAVATGGLYLYATFDGGRLATELSHFAKQRYQRSLRFDAPPSLSMFPRLELRLPAMSLSGRSGDGEFLGFEQGVVGVRLLPLLAQRVVVDRVEFDGLRVAVRRGKDGKLNAADLLAGLPAEAPVELDVDRIALRNGTLAWIDEAGGNNFALSDIRFESGRLARKADGRLELAARLTQATPMVDARVELETAYRFDGDAGQQARNLHLEVKGALAGRPGVDLALSVADLVLPPDAAPQLSGVSVLGKARADGDTLELRAAAPRVVLAAAGPEAAAAELSLRVDGKGQGGQVRARLTGVAGKGTALAVDKFAADIDWKLAAGRLTGKLGGPAQWQGEARLLEIPQLAGDLALTPARAGATPVKIALKAGGRLDLARDSGAGKLDLQVDDSHVQGTWTLPRLTPLAVGVDVDVDRLDVGRYLGSPDASSRFDLSGLQGLDADGAVRVARLTAGGLQFERLRLPFALHGGRFVVPAYSVALYGGTLDGAATLAADGNALAWRGWLQNANLGPLLNDAIGREAASGTLNFFVDVSGKGDTLGALRDTLAGQARLRLRNGVMRGIDGPAALKEWKAAFLARQPGRRPYRETESTPVGEVVASFQVGEGHARSTDVFGRSASFGLNGGIDVSFAGPSIDAATRFTLLAVAPADMPVLGSLRNVTVPVRAKGPLDRPEWLMEPGATPVMPTRVLPATSPTPSPAASRAPAKPAAKPAPARPAPAAQPSAPKPAAQEPAGE